MATKVSKAVRLEREIRSNETTVQNSGEDVVLHVTKANNELKIRRAIDGVNFEVYYEEGGVLPEELKGVWNSIHLLKAAVELFKTKG